MLKTLTLFKSKESTGGKRSLWIALDEHGEKGCMFAKSNHQKGVFFFLFDLWRVQGSQRSSEGVGTVALRRTMLVVD